MFALSLLVVWIIGMFGFLCIRALCCQRSKEPERPADRYTAKMLSHHSGRVQQTIRTRMLGEQSGRTPTKVNEMD